jgi:arsenate reductase
MAEVTIYHNPKCSTSNSALSTAADLGVEPEIVQYLKSPPDRETLGWIIDHLEDPVADLVRKDALFERLGLDAADYTDKESVIALLLEEPKLMQRPVIVKGDLAIIGRPKDRVRQLLEA